MFLLYTIGIITWSIANCNGGALEALVADNVAELLVDHIIDHLNPTRIRRLAKLLAENEEHHKAKSIADSLNDFTIKAYGPIIRDQYEDIIFSPFASYMSLSMLAYGTNQHAEEQLHALLEQGFHDPLEAQTKYSVIIDQLNGFNPSEFNLKYEIFYPDSCTASAHFKRMEKIFRVHSQCLEFRTSVEESRTRINEWFANNVKLPRARSGITIEAVTNDLNEDTNLVVANAVYFNRKFERALSIDVVRRFPDHEQPHATHERQYYTADGIYSHGKITEINAEFIELPYENGGENVSMSMFIVKAGARGSFAEIESYIDEITMEKLLNRSYRRIKVSFPTLSFTTVQELTLPLEHQLRVPEIFSNDANFSRYFDCPNQHVTKFIQKNIVVMRTDGALAPGANLEPWGTNLTDIEFEVDRSFLEIIAVTSPVPSILVIGRRQT